MSSSQLVDSCLLVNRRVEQRQEHSITRTEITQRRVLQEKGPEMPQYTGQPELQQASAYAVDVAYHPTNGHPDNHSPNSSHISLHGGDPASAAATAGTLVSRTQKQQTTQQVTTVTKVVREVHHMGPDGQPVEYATYGGTGVVPPTVPGAQPYPTFGNYEHLAGQEPYPDVDPSRRYQDPYRQTYQDYDHYSPRPEYQYQNPAYPSAYPGYADAANYVEQAGGPVVAGPGPVAYGERPPTPPSPSERSESPPPQQAPPPHAYNASEILDYLSKGAPYPQSGYDELDTSLLPPRQDHYRVTPSPGAPGDRYAHLTHPWSIDETGEPAQLPHDDQKVVYGYTSPSPYGSVPGAYVTNDRLPRNYEENTSATRSMYEEDEEPTEHLPLHAANHSPLLDDDARGMRWRDPNLTEVIGFLSNPNNVVKANAAAYLQHLCYMDDPNKQKTRSLGGIPPLVKLLSHEVPDVYRNACGALRNVSSAGEYARKKLRECEGLVDSLLYVVRSAIDKSNIGNKSVENCVCILRNLSYRCQEVEDPNYDKHPLPTQSRAGAQPKGDNLGCFGANKKKKEAQPAQQKESASTSRDISQRTEPVKGMELLWQPEVVQSYLQLLQSCSNPETLEAAAGALQNLAACYWQPSIEIRAAVRKEKGLPILVELLRMEVDRVVCAVATALRNLAIDQRNKELIGKYAMRDLVQKLPSGNPQHDQGTSDDTIAAVLATLNEVIKKNAEFSRSLLETGGVERLMNITRQRQKYTPRVIKFAGQVLYTMWQHQELREAYKKHGWKEQDFVTKTVAARNASPNSPNNANSTLNRPMASQGGTRYEDRTMQRPSNVNSASRSPGPSNFQRGEEIPMADMSYPEGGSHAPPPGGVRIYPPPPQAKPGEPLYAQVNREKKKNRQYDAASHPSYDGPTQPGPGDVWGYEDQAKGVMMDGHNSGPPAGGDSWV
ncbi:hypothetical protein J437_LFUL006767 [Ladona fulva]|uniref:Catenin delta-2 n=1 Tax=Ladona fulva TaxID=123851 RepID=A0A8K0K2V4_LADFU|nr:hypothetical protein J437_LFUL006767 [Ladona fulva]